MRRFLVLLPPIALAVAVLCASPAAQAKRDRARAPMIVCPLPAASAPPPCCGPPVRSVRLSLATDCCPLPASGDIQPVCCAAASPCSVTISASPNPADSGQQVTVSGTVFGGAPAGTTVQLWQEVAGGGSFSKSGSATVGTDGTYSMTAPGTVMTNRQWYVTTGTLQSATISEQVSAVVTLLTSTGRHSVTVHGTVAPSHSGESVLLQRKVRGKWVTIAHPVLSHRSRFAVRYSGARRSKATLRAVLPADSKNMRSVSSTVKTVVLAHARAG